MKERKLGSQGLVVSPLGLGCMGMSAYYATQDEARGTATVHRALDLGITFFDTAEIYGPFTNEELLGRALGSHRKRVVVATKFAFEFENGAPTVLNGRPERVRESLEGSLRRLKTDYVDLYYQHRMDPSTPIEDTVGALGQLVDRGQGPIHRALRGKCDDHPARARGSSTQRRADRIFALGKRDRGRNPARPP